MPKIDIAKRRRVMQRSQKLGHCICDPRKPCPCDTFTGRGICPCAGERPDPVDLSKVRLTQLVQNAGCASKIAPADLEAVLGRLPAVTDPAVISGIAAGDDAGIYKVSDDLYLVQTVDVMTPCCDDPHTFGRICAANCLSDIYAMGGAPRTALSVLGFPSETLDGQIMYEMLRGAMEVFADAGVALIGGHSVKDGEIKLGFAVTGTVAREKLTEHGTAAAGDALVLTKPLGVGVLNFAHQVGRPMGDLRAVQESMATLNKAAAEAAASVGVSGCTDVTGFGLFGHLVSMVRHSGVTAEIWAGALPAFAGALEALREGVVPGAIERNMEYVGDDLEVAADVEEAAVHLGFDAQTSGGLLIAVPAGRQGALLAALRQRGVPAHVIGRITEPSDGRIIVTSDNRDKRQGIRDKAATPIAADQPIAAGQGACCASADSSKDKPASACCAAAGDGGGAGTSAGAAEAFGAFLKATSIDGKLDARTKELITFALVVMTRCKPCVSYHLKRAQQMGITQAELDEAAWCAVAMGGAPVRMFYLEATKR